MNTHCLPLNLLVELGVVGLLLAIGLLFLGRPRVRFPPAEILVGGLLLGQVIDCFLFEPTTMVVMTCALGALAGGRPDPAELS